MRRVLKNIMNICQNCGKEFIPNYPTSGKNKNIYCSVGCRNHELRKVGFQKNDPRLMGNKNGVQFYKGQVNELQPNWKGDDVGYTGVHKWLFRHKGKAKFCTQCGTDKSVQWANIDHKYSRKLDDYIEMCSSCHKKYDLYMRYGNCCRYGHEWTKENTYNYYRDGKERRSCRMCLRMRANKYRNKKK